MLLEWGKTVSVFRHSDFSSSTSERFGKVRAKWRRLLLAVTGWEEEETLYTGVRVSEDNVLSHSVPTQNYVSSWKILL